MLARDAFNFRNPMREIADHSLQAASRTMKLIEERVRLFEAKLNADEAVMVFMIGGPSGIAFLPTHISAQDPDSIVFEGFDPDGHPFTVIQHVSQLNFALRAFTLTSPSERKPIGFHVP